MSRLTILAGHAAMNLARRRTIYALRRAAKLCTKCQVPSKNAVCPACIERRHDSHAAFVAADRREEWIALSELSALHKVGAPCA